MKSLVPVASLMLVLLVIHEAVSEPLALRRRKRFASHFGSGHAWPCKMTDANGAVLCTESCPLPGQVCNETDNFRPPAKTGVARVYHCSRLECVENTGINCGADQMCEKLIPWMNLLMCLPKKCQTDADCTKEGNKCQSGWGGDKVCRRKEQFVDMSCEEDKDCAEPHTTCEDIFGFMKLCLPATCDASCTNGYSCHRSFAGCRCKKASNNACLAYTSSKLCSITH